MWSAAIVGTTAVVAYFEPPLDRITGITGAVGGGALVYVLPGTIRWKAGGGGGRIMAIGGTIVMVLGTWAVIR